MVFATIVSEFHFVTAGFYVTVAVFTLAALLSPICTCRNNLEQNSTFTHKKKTRNEKLYQINGFVTHVHVQTDIQTQLKRKQKNGSPKSK